MRACLTAFVVFVALALAASTPSGARSAAPAPARSPIDGPGTPVWPGLAHHHLDLRLGDGAAAVANVLDFSPSESGLQLRPMLAQDRVPGLETVPSIARRHLPAGALAGTNGGFWMPQLPGDPNGYLAQDGRLLSEPETQGAGPRATFALRLDGTPLIDRLDADMRLSLNLADDFGISGVNRYYRGAFPHPDHADRLVYLYNDAFGPAANVRMDLGRVVAFTITGTDIPASGFAVGQVDQVLTPAESLPIPPGGILVVAYARAAERMTVRAGMPAEISISLRPQNDDSLLEWSGVVAGLAVGPLIVHGGAMTDPDGWFDEGFSPEVHTNVRHPRSALGITADQRLVLVTVDGRQPGYSAGMTMTELAELLVSLGAVEALSLDGGGSAQFVVDGQLRNRACCDKPLRAVADALLIFHDYEFVATRRLAGDLRSATAAAIALDAYPEGADEVVLASALNFPDALAGGPLAAQLRAPLLLSAPDHLPAATARALELLQPRRVTILGGTSAVGADQEQALAERYVVRRLSGRDRTETAAVIAGAFPVAAHSAVVASAYTFPDALSAAAPAGMLGMPVLLTAHDSLPDATAAALETGIEHVVVVGGEAVVGREPVAALEAGGLQVTRLAGPNRYATATVVNAWASERIEELDTRTLVVARGGAFPDALAGGPYAAGRRQLLQIVPDVDVTANEHVRAFLDERADAGLDEVVLLGGHAALSSYQQWQLDQLAGR